MFCHLCYPVSPSQRRVTRSFVFVNQTSYNTWIVSELLGFLCSWLGKEQSSWPAKQSVPDLLLFWVLHLRDHALVERELCLVRWLAVKSMTENVSREAPSAHPTCVARTVPALHYISQIVPQRWALTSFELSHL